MGNIGPYKAVMEAEKAKLKLQLASGKASVSDLAVQRVMVDIMVDQLTHYSGSVLAFDRMGPDPKGWKGPDRWKSVVWQKAHEQIHPQYAPQAQYDRKIEEYLDYSLKMLQFGQVSQQLIRNKYTGDQYLIMGAHPLVRRIMALLATELMEWARAQPNTSTFIKDPAELGFAVMLSERRDLAALLRMSAKLPLDVETGSGPVDRPFAVEAVELALGLIPVVGSAIACYEAWSGKDIFGYRLTELERGILAATVLLPIAGRLARGGRALYTEARLVGMYGRDAVAWSRAVTAGERGSAQRAALLSLETAERDLRLTGAVAGKVATEVASALPGLIKGGVAAPSVDKAVTDLLANLHAKYPILRSIDAPALQRVLEKGPNVDHLKGQLLEELVEFRLVPWLSKREGSFALGVPVPVGKKLEFIPGHLVRDINARQISDGLLVYRDKAEMVIVAVFEAKAGKSAARELSRARGGMSKLTEAEKAELRAAAKDVWREELAQAQAAKVPYKKKVEDIEKEQFILSELGGQVRRDIERLADGATIRIGAERAVVRISPTRTKFFGVVPKDVKLDTIEAQLKAEKFAYEMIGVDVRASDLKSAAEMMQPVADAMAKAAPVP